MLACLQVSSISDHSTIIVTDSVPRLCWPGQSLPVSFTTLSMTIVCLVIAQSISIHADLASSFKCHLFTVCVVHLADIKLGDLGANTSWLTFSLANQLSS